jgi:hypothetical protein
MRDAISCEAVCFEIGYRECGALTHLLQSTNSNRLSERRIVGTSGHLPAVQRLELIHPGW